MGRAADRVTTVSALASSAEAPANTRSSSQERNLASAAVAALDDTSGTVAGKDDDDASPLDGMSLAWLFALEDDTVPPLFDVNSVLPDVGDLDVLHNHDLWSHSRPSRSEEGDQTSAPTCEERLLLSPACWTDVPTTWSEAGADDTASLDQWPAKLDNSPAAHAATLHGVSNSVVCTDGGPWLGYPTLTLQAALPTGRTGLPLAWCSKRCRSGESQLGPDAKTVFRPTAALAPEPTVAAERGTPPTDGMHLYSLGVPGVEGQLGQRTYVGIRPRTNFAQVKNSGAAATNQNRPGAPTNAGATAPLHVSVPQTHRPATGPENIQPRGDARAKPASLHHATPLASPPTALPPRIHPGWLQAAHVEVLHRLLAIRGLYCAQVAFVRFGNAADATLRRQLCTPFAATNAHAHSVFLDSVDRAAAHRSERELGHLRDGTLDALSLLLGGSSRSILPRGRASQPSASDADEGAAETTLSPPAVKRFSRETVLALERYFQEDPYPDEAARRLLATTLNLTSKQIINWFTNKRMRSSDFRAQAAVGFNQPRTPVRTPVFPSANSNVAGSPAVQTGASAAPSWLATPVAASRMRAF